MSNDPQAAQPPPPEPLPVDAAPAVEPSAIQAPPIALDRFPPNLRKHVDSKSPVPLRMMAAKSLVPMGPPDLIHVLTLLAADADPGVASTAQKTAAGLPDKMLVVALRDEGASPHALDFMARALVGKDTYLETIALNNATDDETIARMAQSCGARVVEVISQNQLRILRTQKIIRAICANSAASGAVVDSVCDFAIRSGVLMDDVPAMVAARVRILGAAPPPPPEATADQIMEEYHELQSEAAPELTEGKKLTLAQKIMKMNVAEKVKLATLGNQQARSIMLRDTNKVVALASINSPRITDGEVMSMANSRTCPDEVMRVIYNRREWLKSYPLRLALAKNPKVPLATSMKFLGTLRDSELKDLAKDKNVPSGVQAAAKKMMEKKNAPKADH